MILNNGFTAITDINTLVAAHKKALIGKRHDITATTSNCHMMTNLLTLQRNLKSNTYRPLPYREHIIYEAKKRQIQAPAFRDRVVHHAIYSVLGPFYERSFIPDSYACRPGRGIHSAASRVQQFLRQAAPNHPLYVCKIDVSKYYASINHQRLLELLSTKIGDPQLINLLKIIISSTTSGNSYDNLFPPDSYYHTKGPRGIPIGNLTSQLFANVYLHHVDMYAKHQLKIRRYIRYMDDILFFHEDKAQLLIWQQALAKFLYEDLYLTVNPHKVRIYPATMGVDFIGYIIYPYYMRLRGSSVRRFKRHYHRQLISYLKGDVSMQQIQTSFDSWTAHAAHAKTKHLVETLKSWQDDYKFARSIQQYARHQATKALISSTDSTTKNQLSLFDKTDF